MIVEVPVLPCTTESVLGEAEIVKLGAVTVRVTVVEFVMVPVGVSVPVTVIGYVPGVVLEATVKVRSEVPVPGEAMGLVPKTTVTPFGRVEVVN